MKPKTLSATPLLTTSTAEVIARAAGRAAHRNAEILLAFAHGEKISFSPVDARNQPNREWNPIGDSPAWNFAAFDYKVRPPTPKKLEIFALVSYTSDGTPVCLATSDEKYEDDVVRELARHHAGLKVVCLVEA